MYDIAKGQGDVVVKAAENLQASDKLKQENELLKINLENQKEQLSNLERS